MKPFNPDTDKTVEGKRDNKRAPVQVAGTLFIFRPFRKKLWQAFSTGIKNTGMKNTMNKILTLVIIAALFIFSSGCYEPRYYHDHHQHSDRYNHHHRERLDIEIHN